MAAWEKALRGGLTSKHGELVDVGKGAQPGAAEAPPQVAYKDLRPLVKEQLPAPAAAATGRPAGESAGWARSWLPLRGARCCSWRALNGTQQHTPHLTSQHSTAQHSCSHTHLYTQWSRNPGNAAVTRCTSCTADWPAALTRLAARPPYSSSSAAPTWHSSRMVAAEASETLHHCSNVDVRPSAQEGWRKTERAD